ncbi:MAG: acyl-CoA dehydrogenase family protein [Mycobacteriales bacterium]
MESKLLRETVRHFVADEWWLRLGRLGLTGLCAPTEFGGAGADAAVTVLVAQELAAGSAALAWMWLEHTDATWILAGLGTEAVKARFLPELATGELVGSALKATEAGGGSNPAAITTTARAGSDGRYILNGRKVFQGLAGRADLYLVVARTEPLPEAGPLSVFVVHRGERGVSFGARERTMGLRALPVAEIVLEDCAVPAEHLVGPPGGFWTVVAHHGRLAPLLVAAIAIGLAEASAREAFSFLADREVAGRRLAELPVIQLRRLGGA